MSVLYAAMKIAHELKDAPLNDEHLCGPYELSKFTESEYHYVVNVYSRKVDHTFDSDANGIISQMYEIQVEILENRNPYLTHTSYTDDITLDSLLKKLEELDDHFNRDYVRPTTDGTPIHGIIHTSSATCSECIYCNAANSDKAYYSDYMCHNESSKNYGKLLNHDSTSFWSCADYSKHHDVSFKDAIRQVLLPDGLTSCYRRYIEPNSEDGENAFIGFSFKSNGDLQKWVDARDKLMKEYIRVLKNKEQKR